MELVAEQVPRVDTLTAVDTVRRCLDTAGCVVVNAAVSGAELDTLRESLKRLVEG